VKVRACQGNESISVQGGWQQSQQFVIALHNRGISLWDMKVYLQFLDRHLISGGSYEMGRRSKDQGQFARSVPQTTEPTPEKHPTEFARGMIAEFEITSAKLYPGVTSAEFAARFSQLTNARKQRASITVHSQDFQACSIPISGFWDRSKRQWNWFADKINRRFDKVIPNPYGGSGQPELDNAPMLIPGRKLPTFLTLEDKLMAFVWQVRQQKQQTTEPHGQG
jgi:hypothetical protein